MLENLFRRQKHTTVCFDRMWFLDETTDALGSRQLPDFVKKALRDLRDNGVAIIPGNISDEICDAVVRDFNAFVRKSQESHHYRDAHLLHDRLACLHMVSEAARRV